MSSAVEEVPAGDPPVGTSSAGGTARVEPSPAPSTPAEPAPGGGFPDGGATVDQPPIGPLGLFGVTVAALGGPLALVALYAPAIVRDAAGSAGLVTVAAAVIFLVPLAVWLRYNRHVQSAGGLYGFVEAAAGRAVARVQAVVWIASYLLYLLYTTAFISYDLLPAALPGVMPYRPVLELAIPVAIAAVLIAGRTVTVAVAGALAAGQLVLVAALAGLTIARDAPAASFAPAAPAGAAALAAGNVALLFICGSLPLFLGGETIRPARTIGRVLPSAYAVVAAGIVAAVFPLAANPAFTRAPVPGVSIARVYAGPGFAAVVAIGVGASVVGVMVVEYLALTRLLHVVTGRRLRPITLLLGAALIAVAPLSLVDPDAFYEVLLKPSLVALWLSQLMVFAVYPRFAARHGGLRVPDLALTVGSCAVALFGLYSTLSNQVVS